MTTLDTVDTKLGADKLLRGFEIAIGVKLDTDPSELQIVESVSVLNKKEMVVKCYRSSYGGDPDFVLLTTREVDSSTCCFRQAILLWRSQYGVKAAVYFNNGNLVNYRAASWTEVALMSKQFVNDRADAHGGVVTGVPLWCLDFLFLDANAGETVLCMVVPAPDTKENSALPHNAESAIFCRFKSGVKTVEISSVVTTGVIVDVFVGRLGDSAETFSFGAVVATAKGGILLAKKRGESICYDRSALSPLLSATDDGDVWGYSRLDSSRGLLRNQNGRMCVVDMRKRFLSRPEVVFDTDIDVACNSSIVDITSGGRDLKLQLAGGCYYDAVLTSREWEFALVKS